MNYAWIISNTFILFSAQSSTWTIIYTLEHSGIFSFSLTFTNDLQNWNALLLGYLRVLYIYAFLSWEILIEYPQVHLKTLFEIRAHCKWLANRHRECISTILKLTPMQSTSRSAKVRNYVAFSRNILLTWFWCKKVANIEQKERSFNIFSSRYLYHAILQQKALIRLKISIVSSIRLISNSKKQTTSPIFILVFVSSFKGDNGS